MQIQKQFDKSLYYRIISDSKRQQTITVDYKRLINGLVLTSVVTLHRQTERSDTTIQNTLLIIKRTKT